MSDQNYTLKNPHKLYIWSISTKSNFRMIFLTNKLNPKDEFWMSCGQFIRKDTITEARLIGNKYIRDYWGDDQEEVFFNSDKKMNQEIIDTHNSRVEL